MEFAKFVHSYNIKSSYLIPAMVAALFAAVGTARADTAAIDPMGSGSDYYQGSYSFGFAFTVTSNVTVSALGFYDAGQNGLNAAHEVGIYDESCNLKASTVVAKDDPLIGVFRYHTISPVTLAPGKYYAATVSNNNDPYLIFANKLEIDSRLTFGGFVVHSYGGDTTLACPNGAGAEPNTKGDFGPNFLISDGTTPPAATATPSGPTTTKRASACTLFCNRTGLGGFSPDGLNTADCYATVADGKSKNSGLIPTGVVKFTGFNGFLPGEGQCGLSQVTQVASCNFQLSIPLTTPPFPIGVAFPIGIEYDGNDTFGPCSAGHKLITATCIGGLPGDEEDKCETAASVNSGNKPKINSSGVISALVECGGNKATPTPSGKQELCIVKGGYSTTLNLALLGLTGDQLLKLGDAITQKDINKFPALKFIKDAKKKYNAEQLTKILASPSDIEKFLKGRRTSYDSVATKQLLLQAKEKGKSQRGRAVTKFSVGTLSAKVPVGTIAEKQVKVPGKTLQLFSILSRLGLKEIPVTLAFTAKRTDQPKKSAKSTETFDLTLP